MNYLYKINEIDKGYKLLGKTGNQLISFYFDEANVFHVSYNNTNIDREGLLIDAERQYGIICDWYVKCDSEENCMRCCSRFMKLVTDGFVSDSHELIAMDWGDLERICKETDTGYYYHAEGNLKHINYFVDSLSGKFNNYGSNVQFIVCVEGNIEMSEFEKVESKIGNIDQNVFQLLYDKNAENIKIDVWMNPNERK